MRGIHAVPRHTARRSDARVRTAPQINPHLNRPPTIDAMEYFLKALFLRRYVTYCARRQRYAQMEGAARLLSEFDGSAGAPRYSTGATPSVFESFAVEHGIGQTR